MIVDSRTWNFSQLLCMKSFKFEFKSTEMWREIHMFRLAWYSNDGRFQDCEFQSDWMMQIWNTKLCSTAWIRLNRAVEFQLCLEKVTYLWKTHYAIVGDIFSNSERTRDHGISTDIMRAWFDGKSIFRWLWYYQVLHTYIGSPPSRECIVNVLLLLSLSKLVVFLHDWSLYSAGCRFPLYSRLYYRYEQSNSVWTIEFWWDIRCFFGGIQAPQRMKTIIKK